MSKVLIGGSGGSKNKNNNMVNYETFESSSEGEMSQCLFES